MSASSPTPLLPGATIGIFGSGQLGRMFTHAAQQMGYRVHVFSGEENSPTGQAADAETVASYDDASAIAAFAKSVDVITLEFENVPTDAARAAAQITPVRPGVEILHIVQHRLREKQFLERIGVPCTPFAAVDSLDAIRNTVRQWGQGGILKTATLGYDGKGQWPVETPADAEEAWHALGNVEVILEKRIALEEELSILVARGVDGQIETCGPIANSHQRHILDVSLFPVESLANVANEAVQIATSIAAELQLVGLICVEFFMDTDHRIMVNEIAPRTHNSGHLTIEACSTSQFQQQVRAVTRLPLAPMEPLQPAAMANLLGDVWHDGEPNWQAALTIPGVNLHLYGKHHPRIGRKMGHLTAIAGQLSAAEKRVRQARDLLQSGHSLEQDL